MANLIEKISQYYGGARQRARRRKSPWNVFLVLFSMVSWAGVWYVLFKSVWSFHTSIYPGHVLKDFWQQGIDFRSGILSFLMVFPLMPGAMAVGFMLANIFFWLLPWSRKAFETEAGGHPGTDFQNTMRRLFIICIWTLPAGLIASIIAAYLLKNLR